MRRAFFWILPGAVVVLPLWMLLGRGLFGAPLGVGLLGLGLAAPVLALGIGAIAGLTIARKEVRGPRRVTWRDVGVVGPWVLAIVAFGMLVVDESGGRAGSALTALAGEGALTASSSLAAVLGLAIVVGGIAVAVFEPTDPSGSGPQAGRVIRIERGDAG